MIIDLYFCAFILIALYCISTAVSFVSIFILPVKALVETSKTKARAQ